MAFDAFLKIDGIEGESVDSGMAGAIDVHSYSFGAQNTAASSGSGGAGAGRAEFTDVSFVISQSKATIPLLLAVAQGTHHDKAELILRREGSKVSEEFFKVTLNDVVVTSLHEAASTVDVRPTDAISLAFQKVTWSYNRGAATGSWDLAQNKKA